MIVRVTQSGSIEDDVLREIKKRLLDLHSDLVMKSPVDTGNFRSNFTVDLNALTIENNSEYAEALAHGHSPQAPDGWIDDSVEIFFPK